MNGRRTRVAACLTGLLLGGAAPVHAADSPITVINASQSDSLLEVDRTANLEVGSGTAGSDHDGSAVDVVQALMRGGSRNAEDSDRDGE